MQKRCKEHCSKIKLLNSYVKLQQNIRILDEEKFLKIQKLKESNHKNII